MNDAEARLRLTNVKEALEQRRNELRRDLEHVDTQLLSVEEQLEPKPTGYYLVDYDVTVSVTVNMDDRTIERVVINDEYMGSPSSYYTADESGCPLTQIDTTDVDNQWILRCIDVVLNGSDDEAAAEWPTWDFGW